VELGDDEANGAVIAALKDVASADESPAQRAMLLSRGLIEMVKGKVVITERGYKIMQGAGVPPKLTPNERRKEIAEKREFARGDFAYPALKKAMGGRKFPDLELREAAGGTLNQSLRKDPEGVRRGLFANLWQSQPQREYPDFFSVGGARIPAGESDKLMKNTRNWAAQTIRGDRRAKREFARGDFLRQAVSKYSDVAPAGVPGVSPSVVGPRGKEWRSQFLLWARKRAAKQLV
jgi:hypothetical protein